MNVKCSLVYGESGVENATLVVTYIILEMQAEHATEYSNLIKK